MALTLQIHRRPNIHLGWQYASNVLVLASLSLSLTSLWLSPLFFRLFDCLVTPYYMPAEPKHWTAEGSKLRGSACKSNFGNAKSKVSFGKPWFCVPNRTLHNNMQHGVILVSLFATFNHHVVVVWQCAEAMKVLWVIVALFFFILFLRQKQVVYVLSCMVWFS